MLLFFLLSEASTSARSRLRVGSSLPLSARPGLRLSSAAVRRSLVLKASAASAPAKSRRPTAASPSANRLGPMASAHIKAAKP